jgi:hypothetical protein
MKKLILVAALAFASTANANPTIPPGVALAIVVVPAVIIVAAVTGNLVPLCKAMGGTYRPAPQGVDVCPDGSWLFLFKGK